MSGFYDGEGAYRLIESKIGPRAALWGLYIAYLAGVLTALALIVSVVQSAAVRLIQPLMLYVPSVPQGGALAAGASFITSSILIGAAAYFFARRLSTQERRLFGAVDARIRPMLDGVNKQLDELSAQSKEAFEVVDKRLSDVEAHTLHPVVPKSVSSLEGLFGVHAVNVHSAFYGYGDRVKDVTEILKRKISNGKLDVVIDNSTMNGDPYYGKPKELQLVYSIGIGPRQQLTISEGLPLRLPAVASTEGALSVNLGR